MVHPHIFWVEFAFLPTTDKGIYEGIFGVSTAFECFVLGEFRVVLQ
jgi:hypothetical protein